MSLPQGFRAWLEKESQLWQQDGLLPAGQRERLLARYPEEDVTSGRLAFALRTFGVLLLGAALLLVIGHNWDDLSRSGRLATVLGGLIGLQGIGLWYSNRHSRQGSVLGHLAGCIMFGAAIALTGQIYHLDAHSPDAILAWCIGTLPFAVLLDSTLLYLGGLILAGVWLSYESQSFGFGAEWHNQAANHRLVFFALLAPAAWAAYRKARPALAGAVAWTTMFAWIYFGNDIGIPYFVLPLVIASLHATGDARARGWRFIGGVGVTVITLVLGDINSTHRSDFFKQETLTSLLILSLALLALWAAVRSQLNLRIWPAGIALTTLLIGIANNYDFTQSPIGGVVIKAIANFSTLALAVWLIRLGLNEGRLRPYVYGSMVFLSWLITRYVDIGHDLGMLTMAGFFALIGVILFVLARVWKTQSEKNLSTEMADYRPAWMEALISKAKPYARLLLIGAVALQAGTIGWMVWHHHQPMASGERFTLRCRPIDPRDLLKGDYVILSYDFSPVHHWQERLLDEEWHQLHPETKNNRSMRAPYWQLPDDTLIFLPLTKNAEGFGEAGTPTLSRPNAGTYLRGLTRRNGFRFGIEAFYVKEGEGRKWEQLRNQGGLAAEIGILPDGRAGLINLKNVPKADLTPVTFRPLERFFRVRKNDAPAPRTMNRPFGVSTAILTETQAFAETYQPAALHGQNAVAPDFSKEMVLTYTLNETNFSTEVRFLKTERDGRLLVATVEEKPGVKQSHKSIPQAAVIVPRAGIEFVEFRNPNGTSISRDQVN